MNTPIRLAVAALVAVLTLSGCGFRGVYDLPLPGGGDLGDNPYRVVIHFENVLDLVPRSSVKVDDVTVGQVEAIELEGWHAKVTCILRGDVRLPDNSVARVEQTSLLGEKFVALRRPTAESASGQLSEGDVIPLSRTNRLAEVEEVLSALSLLLNGGGLQQIQTISRELNAALSGREDKIRSVLHRLDEFVGSLDRQKSEIVRAIEGLDRLSRTLKQQKQTLADAVDQITPAVKILAEQRADLTRMLVALDDLGEVGARVIRQSQQDLVANLRALEPTLRKLVESGNDLPESLEILLTFPFPRTTPAGINGDYTNLRVTVDLNLDMLLNNLLSDTALNPVSEPVEGLVPGDDSDENGGGGSLLAPGSASPGKKGSGSGGIGDLLLGDGS
ncbi:MAG: MCE family protein [Streptosporangiales bacterium]|nr:MCE family protein [Streptosporangiales bacterium]